jgi:LacI family transcriptional regulator
MGAAMNRKPTIQDIAQLAGVGPGTVSRVLNDHPNVSDKTRSKVMAVIEKLDYRPSFSARHMRTQRSHLIGFISDEVATTPYAGSIILGAQETAWQEERVLLLVNVGYNVTMLDEAIEIFLEREVEGIIYAAMYHQAVELPEKMMHVPAVLANCFATNLALPAVIPDEFGGGYTATEALLAKGHRRIGFININTRDPGIPASVGRQAGYVAALAAAGIRADEALVRYGFGEAEDGYRYTHELMMLAEPPTALFCGNDRTAMGAYNALAELNLRIPDDVAVIGFDNQQIIAKALRPALTTMELPHHEMGRQAARILLEQIASEAEAATGKVEILCPLIARASI